MPLTGSNKTIRFEKGESRRMIEFKNVYKTYPNGFTALKDVNLKIEQGEFVAIIGLSGAGKSTILRCINRMHDITKGTLTVDGVDVNSLRGAELRRYRRKVGMIFQSFNLVSRSTAIKNVLTADVPDMGFFKVLFGIFNKEQKMRALESLDKVGILDKAYTRARSTRTPRSSWPTSRSPRLTRSRPARSCRTLSASTRTITSPSFSTSTTSTSRSSTATA